MRYGHGVTVEGPRHAPLRRPVHPPLAQAPGCAPAARPGASWQLGGLYKPGQPKALGDAPAAQPGLLAGKPPAGSGSHTYTVSARSVPLNAVQRIWPLVTQTNGPTGLRSQKMVYFARNMR
jgi:hypothetical protein